ncbi:MAG: hypothetical protein QOD45_108, partial [Pseudonocardiales bacterium]|nr:hypothetical protein [Pseudonocardiales bacterium]
MPSSPPRTLRHAVGVLVSCAVLGAVSGCSTSGPGTGDTGYITGNGVVTTIAAADRKDVPHLSGEALDGSVVDIKDDLGKVVVINVWAAWCPPCRKEAPDLVAAARRLPQVAFIGIDTQETNKAAADASVRAYHVPYDSI